MNLFKKNKDKSLSKKLSQAQDDNALSKNQHEIQDAPASSTQAVMGGLAWYRTQFRRTMKLNIGLVIALCISIAVIAILILNSPTPRYFAATPDLRLAPLVALDKPVLTEQGLLNWTADTITGAISLDFLEWRDKLNALRSHFDTSAYQSLLDSLKSSGTLDMIRDKRLSVSATITQAPVIIASGIIGGKATWRIEFPLLVSYESSQGVESTQHLMATVLVRRASTAKTPRGVVVQQVVLKRNS